MPLHAAGTRPEPAVSVPRARSTSPAATATAEPELEPPGIRPGQWAFGRDAVAASGRRRGRWRTGPCSSCRRRRRRRRRGAATAGRRRPSACTRTPGSRPSSAGRRRRCCPSRRASRRPAAASRRRPARRSTAAAAAATPPRSSSVIQIDVAAVGADPLQRGVDDVGDVADAGRRHRGRGRNLDERTAAHGAVPDSPSAAHARRSAANAALLARRRTSSIDVGVLGEERPVVGQRERRRLDVDGQRARAAARLALVQQLVGARPGGTAAGRTAAAATARSKCGPRRSRFHTCTVRPTNW